MMSYYEPQIRKLIETTLIEFHPAYCTLPAIELLLMTGAAESDFGRFLWQKGGGPAKGFFQIEPATHNSIFQYFFYKRHPMFRQKDHSELATDLRYQIIVARGIYADKPGALPSAEDIKGLATYHKVHWNTFLGKATIEGTIKKYNQFVRGIS